MFRRHHFFVSLSVALVTGILSWGCKKDTQATPRVTFESEIQAGSHTVKDCGQSGIWLTIGSFGNPALGRMDPANPDSPLIDPVRPIDDGAQDQQGTVSVTCSVTGAGSGFDVAAHAELTGATGGAVTITGHFEPTGDQMNITAAISAKQGQTFTDRGCIATFDSTVGQSVAAGRVWATLDCPNAANAGAQQTCKTHAQFRFENCTQ